MMESFPVKFAKILRTSFFTEHLLWLFLTTILFFIAPENIKKTSGFLIFSLVKLKINNLILLRSTNQITVISVQS